MPSIKEEVEEANSKSVSRMMESEPVWVDVGTAEEKLSMKGKTLLHAGPPIDWGRASGPLRGAIIGASLYEEWAETPGEAERMAEMGEIHLAASQDELFELLERAVADPTAFELALCADEIAAAVRRFEELVDGLVVLRRKLNGHARVGRRA